MSLQTAMIDHPADPDTQTMLRVRSGDMAAYELLVRKHRPGIIQFLFGIVRDRAIAEELSQEAFLRCYLARERYEPTAKFTSWLYLIARNLGMNWIRDHSRTPAFEYLDASRPGKRDLQISDGNADINLGMERKARAQGLQRALLQLPERQRTVVMMSKFAGHDCIEIARRLQCTHQAVRSLLFRAYARLRETIDPEVL